MWRGGRYRRRWSRFGCSRRCNRRSRNGCCWRGCCRSWRGRRYFRSSLHRLHKCFRRRVRWRRCFGFHFHANPLCSLFIGDGFPAAIDHDLRDGFFHSARPLHRLSPRNQRSWDDDHFAAHDRLRRAEAYIDVHLPLESQPSNGLLRARANFVVARSLVHDGGVAISDVGNVGRLIDDRHVAFGRHDGALDARRAELFRFNKAVLLRASVIIVVGPIMNASAAIEARFRRQWRPADVVVAFTP